MREALGLMFRKFAEFQSIRQVHLWLRQEQVLLPSVETVEDGRRILWKPPAGARRSGCDGVTSVKVVENAGMDWQPSVMRRRLLQ